ncbi:hypothetical protein Anas_02083 [Armadillidium nasatum]|uniref:Uncharacterized protein n=1 Tax=Armadillidium nasatum TaxID=96803 RepID=A0A5N5T4R0_9CRUS|nr:hypothetical protein Anas_02083 [Armadillidium nasatum]
MNYHPDVYVVRILIEDKKKNINYHPDVYVVLILIEDKKRNMNYHPDVYVVLILIEDKKRNMNYHPDIYVVLTLIEDKKRNMNCHPGTSQATPVNGSLPPLPSPTMSTFNIATQGAPNSQAGSEGPPVFANGLPQTFAAPQPIPNGDPTPIQPSAFPGIPYSGVGKHIFIILIGLI